MANRIYSQLQLLTDRYFNSHNFLDDLIDRHIGFKPEYLTRTDLKKIIDWLEIAAYLLSADQKTAEHYLTRVKSLMEDNG